MASPDAAVLRSAASRCAISRNRLAALAGRLAAEKEHPLARGIEFVERHLEQPPAEGGAALDHALEFLAAEG